jgi:hypothetical protein
MAERTVKQYTNHLYRRCGFESGNKRISLIRLVVGIQGRGSRLRPSSLCF